jgi:peptide-methionine (S)-S-oxide reductase
VNSIIRLACYLICLALCADVVAGQPNHAAATKKGNVTATAIFAGGCFWCVEADFDKVAGVLSTESGYAGGELKNPTYEQVSHGGTGHAESVRVTYDPERVSYEQLLDYFWHHVDPTVKDRQFCDVGNQYRTAIFYTDDAQRRAAQASISALEKSGRFSHVYTQIAPAGTFYPAEEYHQDYYIKNPIRYKYYRAACGRDARVHEIWGGNKD